LAGLVGQRSPNVIVLVEQLTADKLEQAIRAGAIDCLSTSEEWLPAVAEVIRARFTHLCDRRAAKLGTGRERLHHQIRQLEVRNAQLRQLVALDPLTGLYNRRHFSNMLDLLFAVAVRHDQDLTCLMFDLDNFKRVNDELGHAKGDRLLIFAARTIQENIRGSDVAARIGGDEFVALLPQIAPDQACHLAERLCQLFEEGVHAHINEVSFPVTLSVGVAGRKQLGVGTGRALLAAADAALNQTKKAGKSGVSVAGALAPGAG
jgi:diguanylate cyclase (GGDEF)-like protein